jgi:hypothetical protein
MIFDGFFFVIVEKFYNVYHIGSMAMVSWTGTWAFVFNFVPLLIFNFVKCDDNATELCAGITRENTSLWFKQVFGNSRLFWTLPGLIVSIMTYSYTSLALISESTALVRTLWKQCEPILIWGITFTIGWEDFLPL